MTEGVRRLGVLVETVHAVVYFAPEPQAEYAALGLRGYWRGYFASRACALGPVGPELLTALLAGFAPGMVARAVPDVWSMAPPATVRQARLSGAVAALRRLVGDEQEGSVAAAAELTGRCVGELRLAGRPMAAAHCAVPRPNDPWSALWHECTVLREYRGDGHGRQHRGPDVARAEPAAGRVRRHQPAGVPRLGRPDMAASRRQGRRSRPE